MEKFGVREVANIVFKAKTAQSLGKLSFDAGEPVIYFDSAKTSTVESSSTAVYAMGGRGNPKLITWEGEKTMTFTFEDALLTPESMSILLGAELAKGEAYKHHITVKTVAGEDGVVDIKDLVSAEYGNGIVVGAADKDYATFIYTLDEKEARTKATFTSAEAGVYEVASAVAGQTVLVDTYISVVGTSLEVPADKFAGYYYIEAETLFRDVNGVDHAAQLVFPKGKVQSSFSLSMANSGDPSTFTFTIDVMEDYLMGDRTKKRLVAINVID